jgi:hypothetical protein
MVLLHLLLLGLRYLYFSGCDHHTAELLLYSDRASNLDVYIATAQYTRTSEALSESAIFSLLSKYMAYKHVDQKKVRRNCSNQLCSSISRLENPTFAPRRIDALQRALRSPWQRHAGLSGFRLLQERTPQLLPSTRTVS